MEQRSASDPVLDRIASHLRERGAAFAYVFGSYGTPSFGPASDIDIAVSFAPRRLAQLELLALADELSGAAARQVDLADLLDCSPILRMQVLRRGTVILVGDSKALAEFRMKTPSIYEDLRIVRRASEEALWNRGKAS